MSDRFAIAQVLPGKLNALVKTIMRQTGENDPNEAVRLINSGEWGVTKPTPSWRKENGVIYFSVTSNGTTGPEWVAKQEGFLSELAKSALLSPDFTPTKGITTDVAVLGVSLFEDDKCITKEIRAEAYAGTFTQGKKLFDPNAELACLIREKFTDEEIERMGLWAIVAMHKPISIYGDPILLYASRSGRGPWFSACLEQPRDGWLRTFGFAFAMSQVSTPIPVPAAS